MVLPGRPYSRAAYADHPHHWKHNQEMQKLHFHTHHMVIEVLPSEEGLICGIFTIQISTGCPLINLIGEGVVR